jgi:hypothetical protein
VWGYAAKTHMNKLQIFQNKVLRIITQLPRVTLILTLYEQRGMPLIRRKSGSLRGQCIRRLQRAITAKLKDLDITTPLITNICVPYLSLQVKLLCKATLSNYTTLTDVKTTEGVFIGIHNPGIHR